MRTTLTLEDDVASLLKKVRKRAKGSLKKVVNEALRRGLSEMDNPPEPHPPYRVKPLPVGRCLLGDIDDIAEVLAVAEGEDFD